MLFHSNSGYMNVPQCYIAQSLPVLLQMTFNVLVSNTFKTFLLRTFQLKNFKTECKKTVTLIVVFICNSSVNILQPCSMEYEGQNKDKKLWLWRARAAHSPTCWYPVEDYSMSLHLRYKSEQRPIKEGFYLLLMFWAQVFLTPSAYFISSITKI